MSDAPRATERVTVIAATRARAVRSCIVACAVAALATGCSSSHGAGAAPGDAGAQADASADQVVTTGVSLSWLVTVAAGITSSNPLAGVPVCVLDHPEIVCAMTAADGSFTLGGLPPGAQIVLTLVKTGYVPLLVPIETAHTAMLGNLRPITMSELKPPSGSSGGSGVAIDIANKGFVVFFAIHGGENIAAGVGGGGESGATVQLSPAGGDGPFFLDANGALVSSSTSIVNAAGIYFNLDPGDYTLTFDDAVDDCEPISYPFGQAGFPLLPHSVKFPILAGHETATVGVLCTPKSRLVATDDAAAAAVDSGDD